MIQNAHEIVAETAKDVRGGSGIVHSHKLLSQYPGSALQSVGLVRLEPGATIGAHAHHGDEDFYYCISGSGIVVDNGVEHAFTPGTLQITRSGETQELRNTGTTELVFLGALAKTRT